MFWDVTLAEVEMILGGVAERLQREHNDRAWHAWHIAALPLKKKFPKLDTLLVKIQKPRRRQTWQEQMAIMQAWGDRLAKRRQ